jgi:hypothetical protein
MPFNGDAVRGFVLSCDYTQGLPDVDAFSAWLGAR